MASVHAVPVLQVHIQGSIGTWCQLGWPGFSKIWFADKPDPSDPCATFVSWLGT